MPTKNPRINITVDPDFAILLTDMAKQEKKSLSNFALELLLEAFDRREDLALSHIAKIRDIKKAKTIKHEDVWK